MREPSVPTCCHFFVMSANHEYKMTGETYSDLWDAKGCNLTSIIAPCRTYRVCCEVNSFGLAVLNMQARLAGMERREALYRLFLENDLSIVTGLQTEAMVKAQALKLDQSERLLVLFGGELFPQRTIDMITLTRQLSLAMLEYSPLPSMRQIASWRVLYDHPHEILGIEFDFETSEAFHRRKYDISNNKLALPPKDSGE